MAKEAEFNADAKDGDGDGMVQDGTIWERPVGTQPEGFKADARDGDGDGRVQDGTPFERDAAPTAVVADAGDKKSAKKAPAKDKKADPKTVPTELSSLITVSRAKLVYKSLFEHNSRSVGVTQIRLVELGYPQAGADKRGYLGDPTLEAIKEFADDHGLEANDLTSEALVQAIFAGTPVTIGM